MIIWLLFLLGIVISTMFVMVSHRESIVEKNICLGFIYFFMAYGLIAAFLFCISRFAILKTLIGTDLFMLVGFLFVARSNLEWCKNMKPALKIKSSGIVYIVIIVISIFHVGHYEFFGMQQDQGVYQIEAINLLNGASSWRQEIDEYQLFDEGKFKDYFHKEWFLSMPGFEIRSDSKDDVYGFDRLDESRLYGFWHGLPTYASMLALGAKLFGISDMTIIQAIFYVLFLFLLEFLLEEKGFDITRRCLAVTVLANSPQMVWIKKSTLTEMFLGILILLYIYYLVSDDRKKHLFSLVPILEFCFFHVSIYTILPIFLFNYCLLFFYIKKRKYLYYNYACLVGYFCGTVFSFWVQPYYTTKNYEQALHILPVNLHMYPIIILGAIAIATIINSALLFCKTENINVIYVVEKGMIILSAFAILFFTGRIIIKKYVLSQILVTGLVCYCMLTGIVVLPLILVMLISGKFKIKSGEVIAYTTFAYLVLFYTIAIRPDIKLLYYYGRYLVPFLSIIIIAFLLLFREKKLFSIFVLSFATLVCGRYAYVINEGLDDSRMEWSAFSEICEQIQDADVVFLDPYDDVLCSMLYHPIRSSGKNVLPLKDQDPYEILEQTNLSAEKIYYISRRPIPETEETENRIVYKRNSFQQLDDMVMSKFTGLAISPAVKREYAIYVMDITDNKFLFSTMDSYWQSGWSLYDPALTRWINGEEASVKVYLPKAEPHRVTFLTGNIIPFELINKKQLHAEFYVNGKMCTSYVISAENAMNNISFEIPGELLLEGENIIDIKCETWSPIEYGAEDTNEYGFSVYGIVLE